MIRRYEIFADYHQFYLWDHARSPDTSLDYTDEDVRRRIKADLFLVVIQPERNMTVPVEIEIAERAPISFSPIGTMSPRRASRCPRVASRSTNAPVGRSISSM